MTAQDIKETNEALAIARSEREKYGKVIESGEKTASSLYDTADKGYSFAKKLSEESTAGTKGIKKGVLSIVPAATQIGLQTAERMVAPGMDVAGRALSVAGGNAADYRRKAGEQYDAEKATLRATVSALGVAAGGALSKGVNAAGLKLLRTAGKQNYVLPNIALGGASAVGYAAGETGRERALQGDDRRRLHAGLESYRRDSADGLCLRRDLERHQRRCHHGAQQEVHERAERRSQGALRLRQAHH